jgi:rod shape-determining protein MreD
MKPAIGLRRGALVVCVAFVLDMALGRSLTLAGIRPDITLAAAVAVALLVGDAAAAWIGLLAGALQGAFTSVAFGSLAVSRSVAAWGVGMLDERLFRDNPAVAAAAGFVSVIAAEALFFVFAPQPDALAFASGALGRAVYNMALVVPITAALRPMLRRRQ